ncbi:MAG TPA: 4-hydroxybenzoate octaprenyltransferase [Gammaproteobacteria bacterium]|nr:4-hydroxybenzoate octaprenyltransferase [Gammaproteobacteria bacterium]
MQADFFNKARLREYGLLMRLDKPIGTFLLLWPTWWALWIAAEGFPDPVVFVVFTAGVFLMRSAGCVINDYADKDIDGHVERTKHRPLAEKRISSKEALFLFAALAFSAFLLVLFMNPLTIALSFIGVLLAASYPFMKRFTHFPQVVLGIAFAWAVPMAFAAQTGTVPVEAWLLFLATVFWTTAYDTMYAMVDREDDLKIGVKSTAILFADKDRHMIAALQFAALLLLTTIGVYLLLSSLYYSGLFVAAILAIAQQRLIYHREKKSCFRAFLNNQWFGAAIFSGIFLHYLFV